MGEATSPTRSSVTRRSRLDIVIAHQHAGYFGAAFSTSMPAFTRLPKARAHPICQKQSGAGSRTRAHVGNALYPTRYHLASGFDDDV